MLARRTDVFERHFSSCLFEDKAAKCQHILNDTDDNFTSISY